MVILSFEISAPLTSGHKEILTEVLGLIAWSCRSAKTISDNSFCQLLIFCFASPDLRYHLSLSLVDRWGTKDDWATTVLHSSLFSAFRRASPNFKPVHSVTLSSHLFFCLPLLLPPCTVPCRIIFASPVDLVMCPYHLSLRFFAVVRRSS